MSADFRTVAPGSSASRPSMTQPTARSRIYANRPRAVSAASAGRSNSVARSSVTLPQHRVAIIHIPADWTSSRLTRYVSAVCDRPTFAARTTERGQLQQLAVYPDDGGPVVVGQHEVSANIAYFVDVRRICRVRRIRSQIDHASVLPKKRMHDARRGLGSSDHLAGFV